MIKKRSQTIYLFAYGCIPLVIKSSNILLTYKSIQRFVKYAFLVQASDKLLEFIVFSIYNRSISIKLYLIGGFWNISISHGRKWDIIQKHEYKSNVLSAKLFVKYIFIFENKPSFALVHVVIFFIF